ncbi:hypothetical protein EVAR_15974_1 [Eumeta japonica]|uniref:Uncharacterized protein n=1 Tax=Eumeta variegata TaxID=151549 RepID=A0A4C1UL71_EUMVA|nr:hypothetical protein EVAR_15974_1 [Eumeta japonica]
MTHCLVPPEPSARARARNQRSLFHSIGRCVRVEERQRPVVSIVYYNNCDNQSTDVSCQIFPHCAAEAGIFHEQVNNSEVNPLTVSIRPVPSGRKLTPLTAELQPVLV